MTDHLSMTLEITNIGYASHCEQKLYVLVPMRNILYISKLHVRVVINFSADASCLRHNALVGTLMDQCTYMYI